MAADTDMTHLSLRRHGLVPALGLCAILAAMATAKYFTLHTTFADLILLVDHLEHLSERGWWPVLFWGHLQPLKIPLAVLHAALPDAARIPALLIGQAVLLALPAAALWRRHGAMGYAAYALAFPLWYIALFDVHIDAVAVPLLFWFAFAEADGRLGRACVPALMLALVKETFALQTVACGLFLLVRHGRRARVAGSALALFGAAYFVLAVGVLLPGLGPSGGGPIGAGAFGWLGGSLGEMLRTILTDPARVLSMMFGEPGKLLYVGALIAAFLGLPLLAPSWWIVALPPLALSLLSTQPNHYGLGHHYTAGLLPPLTMAFCAAWPRVRDCAATLVRPRTATALALCAVLAVHVALSPSPVSRLFWTDKIWSYGWRAYVPTARDAMIRRALDEHIPKSGVTCISAQNTVVWHSLLRAERVVIFPAAAYEAFALPNLQALSERSAFLRRSADAPGHAARTSEVSFHADFVVLDLMRPLYLGDLGCDWRYGVCTDDTVRRGFLAAVERTRQTTTPVFERDGFIILRRRGAPSSPPAGKDTPS